jgi:HD-GYP domain-containing protein (c-di-GMP phosphodiesterase class II)
LGNIDIQVRIKPKRLNLISVVIKGAIFMNHSIELRKLLFCLLEALDITAPEQVKSIIKSSYILDRLLTTLDPEHKEPLLLSSIYISLLNAKKSSTSIQNKLLQHKIKGFESTLQFIQSHDQGQLIPLMNTSQIILKSIDEHSEIDKNITKSYLFKPKLKNAITTLINDPGFLTELEHPLLEQTIYEKLPAVKVDYQLHDYENFALFLNIWANEQSPQILSHSVALGYVVFTLAKCFNLPDDTCHRLKTAGLFHTLGKMGIDNDILMKYPNISKDEEVEFQSYPYYTFKIIKHLEAIKDIVLWATYDHHRLTDIEGDRKALLEIEIQLLAIAELYVSYRQDKPSQEGLPIEKAITTLTDVTEKIFNPSFVLQLKKNLGLIEKSRKAGLDLAQKILDPEFTMDKLHAY